MPRRRIAGIVDVAFKQWPSASNPLRVQRLSLCLASSEAGEERPQFLCHSASFISRSAAKGLATSFAARFMVFGHFAHELLAVLPQCCDV